MGLKNYFIKKGKHRSGLYPNLYYGKSVAKYNISFSQSCIYSFGNTHDLDINKLFGLSFGYHHINSVRFGWNADNDKIAIHAYCYKSGQRFMSKMISIPVETFFTFEINAFEVYYELKIIDQDGKIISTLNVSKPKTVKWGYRLFPYFGGTMVAPHDVEIKMRKLC